MKCADMTNIFDTKIILHNNILYRRELSYIGISSEPKDANRVFPILVLDHARLDELD